MSDAKYYVFTGATSGLGLEAVRHLVESDSHSVIIVGVREPNLIDALNGVVPEGRLHVFRLDTSSLESVRLFVADVLSYLESKCLSGIALNAGIQIVSGDQFSVDGFDLTFATNVLGHIALYQHLVAAMDSGTVIVSTASGTHDSEHKLAKPYKFFGGYFPSAAEIALGKVSGSTDKAQIGRDRYATSKLCNILFTYAMARRCAADSPRFIAFDPGLMPGTQLVRDQPAALQFAWHNILPAAAKLIDGASTAKQSGGVLADLLTGKRFASETGAYVEYSGEPIGSSKLSYDTAAQDELLEWATRAIDRQ